MKRALIEAVVAEAVEAVLAGKAVEDDRIECKAKLFEPNRVRQLAGSANSALGDEIIWIVGLDEDAGVLVALDQEIDLADWWAKVESNFDGGVAPGLTTLHVSVAGGTVLAMHLTTDRAPYLVKVQGGGSPELEIPWRTSTRTRSARRNEVLRVLLPSVAVPSASLLSCNALLTDGPDGRLRISGELQLYIETTKVGVTVLPAHLMSSAVTIWGASYDVKVRPAKNVEHVGSSGVELTDDGVYLSHSGIVRLVLDGKLAGIGPHTPEDLRKLRGVQLTLRCVVAGAGRAIALNSSLLSKFDQRNGPTLLVGLELG